MKTVTRTFYESAVRRAIERITARLDDALDLAGLAREAALSPLHFHRIFRGMVGETPLELHRRLRLERAASQLVSSEIAVTTVAFDAGYETHEAFTRAFRQSFGVAPSTFRQNALDAIASHARPLATTIAARSGLHFSSSADDVLAHLFPSNIYEGATIMNVEIKTLPAQRVAAVHHVGPYNRINEAFQKLGSIVGPAGLIGERAPTMVAIYHDDPESTPAPELQSDAGLVVPEEVKLPAGLREQRLRAGRYACAVHVGPYTELGDFWARFMGQWLPQSGHRAGEGVSFEIYRNTPENTPPEKLVTEVYLPIA